MAVNSISIVPRSGPALAPSPPAPLHLQGRTLILKPQQQQQQQQHQQKPHPQLQKQLQHKPKPNSQLKHDQQQQRNQIHHSVAKSSPPSTGSSPIDMASPVAQVSISAGSSSSSLKIGTSKDWVLPPRPKPGRKPAVDTPVSKRKAQNRAAQRAFRERRANRVQELEQKLSEVEKENELKELGFINTITKLQAENKYLKRSLEQLRLDVDALSSNKRKNPHNSPSPGGFSRSTSSKSTPIALNGCTPPQPANSPNSDLLSIRPIAPSFPKHNSHASTASTSSSAGADLRGGSYAIQQVSPAPSMDSPTHAMNSTTNDDDKSCGICTRDDCLCEEVGLKEVDPDRASVKLEEQLKTFKPMAAVSLRRKRDIGTVQEFDFTSKFSTRKPMPDLKKLRLASNFTNESTGTFRLSNGNDDSLTSLTALKKMDFDENSPVENCGFCSDDTPCVCREAAQEAARLNQDMSTTTTPVSDPMDTLSSNALPPLQIKSNQIQFRKTSLPVMHPGPSVEIQSISNLTPGAVPIVVTPTQRSTTVILGSEQEQTNGCTGNPGTCRQCQTDPMSTLFCTTVASKAKNGTSEAEELDEDVNEDDVMEPVIAADDSNATTAPTPPNTVTTPTALGTPVSAPGLLPHISRHNSISMNISSSRTEPLPIGRSMSRPGPGIFIPCSDAYKTLSRHEKFNSMDFGTLVGKLTTRGMQVDASSVAKVLRELDKKVFN